jgi:hypothetical protein
MMQENTPNLREEGTLEHIILPNKKNKRNKALPHTTHQATSYRQTPKGRPHTFEKNSSKMEIGGPR